jgi:uncharacterized protein
MTLAEQITQDMMESMKAGTAERTSTLRLLKSAMKNEEIKLGHPLSEDETLKLLQAQGKQRRDSIAAYEEAGRAELAAEEKAELEIISTYLPAALSEDELKALVATAITETGATEMKQMGMVIAAVMKQVAGKAEGGDVSRLVKEALS